MHAPAPVQRSRQGAPKTEVAAPPVRVGFVLHVMQVAGAEVLVSEIIHRLGSAIEPVVLCLDGVGALGERLRAEGVDVVNLGRRPGLDLGVAKRMAREIRSRRIEVLHAHQYTPFFYAAIARVMCAGRPRLIFTEHGRHYPDVVPAKRRIVNRLVLNRLANDVTAVCGFSATSLAEKDGFAGRRIRVIENGIDLDRYAPNGNRVELRRRLGLDPSRKYVANVARFHPVKDQATLLRAFADLAAQRPDVDLLLVGDGPLRASLVELAGALGISDRVRFLGVRDDVPDLLGAVDLFVLTSVSEAASITLLEAMMSGVPVVVTEVGGNPEMVRQGVEGLLVPRADPQATAEAMDQVLEDPAGAAAMGAAGAARVRTHYRLTTTVTAYGDLYRDLAGRAS